MILLIHLDLINPLKKENNNLTHLKQAHHIWVNQFNQKLHMETSLLLDYTCMTH